MKNRESAIKFIPIIIATILWGFSFIWTNQLLQNQIPVFTIIFIRLTLAAIILSTVSIFLKQLQRIERKDIPWFLMLVFCEPFMYFIGETFGLKAVNSPTIGAIIVATIPLFSMIAGIYFYKERISKLNILGILMTLPGILLVVLENGWDTKVSLSGILLLFLAVFSATGYSVVVRRLSDKYNSYTIVSFQNIIGAIYFLPLFLIYNGKGFSFERILSIKFIYPILALAALCSVLAFVFFVNSIRVLGVARTNFFSSLIPAVSAAGAYMLGQEGMSYTKAIGIVVVIIGVIIAQRDKKSNLT